MRRIRFVYLRARSYRHFAHPPTIAQSVKNDIATDGTGLHTRRVLERKSMIWTILIRHGGCIARGAAQSRVNKADFGLFRRRCGLLAMPMPPRSNRDLRLR